MMSRIEQIRKFVDRSSLSVEIAPYHSPILKKSDGYNVLSLDVFDTDTLIRKAKEDPNVPDELLTMIEPVDIVGDACSIGTAFQKLNLERKVNSIVSSHNFEHLPNPIKFFRGCSVGLKIGGVLSMAIPDYRACFDHFRFPTRLSDWLFAYRKDLSCPSPEMRFDSKLNASYYKVSDLVAAVGCDISTGDKDLFVPNGDIQELYPMYLESIEATAYEDTHVSVLTPNIFKLHLLDLSYVGLIDFEIIEVSETVGLEFFVHLRKVDKVGPSLKKDEYQMMRKQLLYKVNSELGSVVFDKKTRTSHAGYKRAAMVYHNLISSMHGMKEKLLSQMLKYRRVCRR